ncbi:MAG: DUF4038 domain-containing protein, partial [candidate division KSB1 bacterium]|nr:DUF4038 domain-containing protein [candidate division KSB1 bacterium]
MKNTRIYLALLFLSLIPLSSLRVAQQKLNQYLQIQDGNNFSGSVPMTAAGHENDLSFGGDHIATGPVALYEIYEIALSARTAGPNPYRDGPEVSVTFTGTSGNALGKSLTVKGFWNGGSNYRVRFAPTATGDWAWISSSSDMGLNGKSGTLTCSGTLPSGHASTHGYVRESVTFPYTFAHEDGTPFFLMGDTQWLFSSSEVSWPTEFQKYVEARAAQGFNYIHGQIYALNPPGAEGNEGGPPFYSSDVDNLNPGYWQQLDQRVAYLNAKGIIAGLVLAWADEGWQQFSTQRQVERYVQYVTSRYSAYNIIWITAGEYEEADPPGGHSHLGQFLKAMDPYGHPITTHTIDTSADDFGKAAWHTTIYEQTSDPAQITRDRRYHKPVINAEFGYEGDQSPEEVRRDAWEILMRGGFFVYGNTATFHSNATMTPESLYSDGAVFMTILKNFWTNNGKYTISWWKFSRFESLGQSRWLAAQPGVAYVVYADNPDPFTIDLSDAEGEIRGQWFDTRRGQWNTTFADSASTSFILRPPGSGFAAYLTSSAITEEPEILPIKIALRQYPNPFREVTRFEVSLPVPAQISLKVFDLQGRELITLSEGAMTAGRFLVIWNGVDQTNRKIAAGIYFAVLRCRAKAKTDSNLETQILTVKS